MFSRKSVIGTLTVVALFGAAILTLDVDVHVKDAWAVTTPATDEQSSAKPSPNRDVYYPGTEELAAD